MADGAQTYPHFQPRILQRGIGQAGIHIGPVHGDTVPARIGHQGLRRIEAHGLRTQQGRAECGRMMQLEPGRIEHQRGETLCMTFWKSEIGKGIKLFVDPIGQLAGYAV
ncbi:Uncharacterised protein [Mycobacteroides abscessus subsp. abscessus]|nr:Uncharacterised protein [Mycobacteroides abscessus subsp. abscessus]